MLNTAGRGREKGVCSTYTLGLVGGVVGVREKEQSYDGSACAAGPASGG